MRGPDRITVSFVDPPVRVPHPLPRSDLRPCGGLYVLRSFALAFKHPRIHVWRTHARLKHLRCPVSSCKAALRGVWVKQRVDERRRLGAGVTWS